MQQVSSTRSETGQRRTLRVAPHRYSLNDIAPPVGRRVSARDAMAEFRARGLDEVVSADLEVYRLVMLPAEFKRLCRRLDQAIADHVAAQHRPCAAAGLPFGEDLQEAADRGAAPAVGRPSERRAAPPPVDGVGRGPPPWPAQVGGWP